MGLASKDGVGPNWSYAGDGRPAAAKKFDVEVSEKSWREIGRD